MNHRPKPPLVLTTRGVAVLAVAVWLLFFAVAGYIGAVETGLYGLPWENR